MKRFNVFDGVNISMKSNVPDWAVISMAAGIIGGLVIGLLFK